MQDKRNTKYRKPTIPIEDLAVETPRLPVPPHSAEAEFAIIGALLLDAPRVLDVCDVANITPESFWINTNRIIFKTIHTMNGVGKPIDAVTVSEELKREGVFDEIGGMEQIEKLIDSPSVIAHAAYYAAIVHEKQILRKIIGVSVEAQNKCYEQDRSVELIVSETEERVFSISTGNKDKIYDFDKEVQNTFGNIDKLLSRKDGLSGLSTGFKNIDEKLFGMRNSEMIVLAARPSMGKTSLAMNICENIALGSEPSGKLDVRERVPVGIFSCEMSVDSLITRMLCSRAKVNLQSAMNGFISSKEATRNLSKAASTYLKAPIFIDDTGGLDIMDLRSRARRMKKKNNIGFLMIDYLQLLNSRAYSAQGRQLETSHISANIKSMAKELEIPVMVISQLSRKPEDEKDGRPRISHLRDSGSIEQDADVVMLLWRPSYYQKKPDDGGVPDNSAKLDIGKNRNGAVGVANLTFDNRYTQFYDAAPGTVADDKDAD